MKRMLFLCLPSIISATTTGIAAQGNGGGRTVAADSLRFAEVVNSSVQMVTHLGRRAVHLSPRGDGNVNDMLAILSGSDFGDGTIELDVAGAPLPGTSAGARGFIGLAFHVSAKGDRFEAIYLRPTNGRADDQLRRSHSVQYEAEPDYPWHRLRSESPGVYESYVDLEPDTWTHMRIVVAGTTARLYVNGARQPCLVVNDLKHGASGGGIALWANIETDAFFSNVTTRLAAQPPADGAVLATIEQLFAAMRTRDTAGVRAAFEPGARLVGIRPRADGSTYTQALSVDQFVAFVGRDNRGAWIERTFQPKVFIDGTMATVWAEYDFHLGDRLTNCGTDSVQLLNIGGAWKIVSIADTYRTSGCPDHGPPGNR